MESPDEAHLAPVPGGHALVLLGRLRAALGGPPLAGPRPGGGVAVRPLRLKALWVLGYVAVLQGDTVGAVSALQECREEGERAGDATAVAYAVHRTGCLSIVTDDPAARGGAAARGARPLPGDRRAEQQRADGARSSWPWPWRSAATWTAAAASASEVREICEDHGERWALAYALYVLAYAALHAGAERAGAPDARRGRCPSRTPSTTCWARSWRWSCWPWSRRRRATRRRRRCSRARRTGSGPRWACRCSAPRTTGGRGPCARSGRGRSWATRGTTRSGARAAGWTRGPLWHARSAAVRHRRGPAADGARAGRSEGRTAAGDGSAVAARPGQRRPGRREGPPPPVRQGGAGPSSVERYAWISGRSTRRRAARRR